MKRSAQSHKYVSGGDEYILLRIEFDAHKPNSKTSGKMKRMEFAQLFFKEILFYFDEN